MIVCNRDSKECMVHRCNKCPGIEKACKFIQNILNGDIEDDLDFDVTFMQWVTTDQSNLITQIFYLFYVKNLIQLQHIYSEQKTSRNI